MVFAVVAALAGLVKVRLSKTQVDNNVFKLHYRWTTSFCFLCAGLIAASDFIGNPIQCLFADDAVTTYCWVASTYTINTTSEDSTYYKSSGNNVHHGVGLYDPDKHEKTYHAYYQFVPFVLFIQGCLFYLPHQIWKMIEGKHAENLIQGLNIVSFDGEAEKKKQNILKYMKISKGLNQKYCYGYVICEFLNFVNVVAQMLLLNAFFGGLFLEYGSRVLAISLEEDRNRNDAMIQTFPRVTKCDFFTYGSSGTLQQHDYICILPQNLLNEKVFLIMWVWMVFLATVTGVQLLYRIAIFYVPLIRLKLLEQRGRISSSYELEQLVRDMSMGDFFLLHMIGHNVSSLSYRDIIKGLSEDHRKPMYPEMPLTETYRPVTNNGFVNDTDTARLRNKMEMEMDDMRV